MATIYPMTSIDGKSDVQAVSNSATAIATAAAGTTCKVNALIVTNYTSQDRAITVDLYRSSTQHIFVDSLAIPAYATVAVIKKDYPVYLEAGDALRLTASAASSLKALCSYDLITS